MSDEEEEISRIVIGIRLRIDTLASINDRNMMAPGWPPSRYLLVIEEAYAALRIVESHIDTLRAELEYQHIRLDEIRDIALTREKQ
jgi:hypothetical protein